MGGVVTQTRVFDRYPDYLWTWDDYSGFGAPHVEGTLYYPSTRGLLPHCQQTTTSYRSGRTEYSDENAEVIPTSRAAAFKQYRKEYLEQRSEYDNGHAFKTAVQEVQISHPHINLDAGPGILVYQGPLIIDPRYTAPRQWELVPSEAFDPLYYGPRAIAQTIPTNPVANLAVSLAELRKDGLPSLAGAAVWQSKSFAALLKGSGKEYLNVEFGWKPLVDDISDTLLAVFESKRLLQQVVRDSGRNVRRGMSFPETYSKTEDTPIGAALWPMSGSSTWPWMWGSGNGNGTLHVTTEIRQRIWFRGAYTYYLPPETEFNLKQLDRIEQRYNRLFGFRFTPEVLWELAPWSWLGDWGVNIGDNLHNASALAEDGLVLRYGYLMCQTTREVTYSLRGVYSNVLGSLAPITHTFRTTTKERVKANPYGFSTVPGSFTDRQWAVLGALGMTKTPNSLR